MSQKIVEFHFDFASPTTYLAYTQVQRIAHEAGASVVWHPVLLGGESPRNSWRPVGLS